MLDKQLLEKCPPPDACGVYIMKDVEGRAIYVGKAVNLRNRVHQYLQVQESPKTRALVKNMNSIEYILTNNEIEALLLEATFIKEHSPRYNIRLKDDKAYPYIKITADKYPGLQVARRRKEDGARYFGPYTNARAVHRTVKLASEIFKIRKCKKKLAAKNRAPCLNYHIGLCSAPCAGKITQAEYREIVESVSGFLSGNYKELVKQLKSRMQTHAQAQEYEIAREVRDQISAIEAIAEKQQTIASKGINQDIIACRPARKESIIELLKVRDGALIGKKEHLMSTGGAGVEEIITSFIQQYYQVTPPPEEIITQSEIEEKELTVDWLSTLTGKKVTITTPRQGRKKELIELASKNAELYHKQRQLDRTDNPVEQLQQVLNLETLPVHIEAFDISHTSGTNPVAGMVVFKKGVPDKKNYRRYKIKTVTGIDDYAMIAEVIGRRYRRMLRDKLPLPDLILVDGGIGQVHSAHRTISSMGLHTLIIGLAKTCEEIHRVGKKPLMLPKGSSALKLLQRIRDEAHRFANSYQQKQRAQSITSQRMNIPGVGDERRRKLLECFKSTEELRRATPEEIAKIPGFGEKLASGIVAWLREQK